MARARRFNNRELTALLRKELEKAHDLATESGGIITKGEALVELLLQKALGWIEYKKIEAEDGTVEQTKIIHKSEAWAVQLVYDRCEGKTPQALPDEKGGITAEKKIRDLAKARINEMTKKAVEAQSPGPPVYKRKKNGSDT